MAQLSTLFGLDGNTRVPHLSSQPLLRSLIDVSMGFAANVYAEQLAPRAHGWPLWEPEPTKEGEVLIGDVGYIYDGGFFRLFNVTLPENHPVNAKGVPEDFVRLNYNHRLHAVRDPYIDAGPLCSRSVQSFSVGGGGGG